MKTTKEAAQDIRAQLKARGIAARQVSVRVQDMGVDAAINVLVKDPAVSLAVVREIAKAQERVDFDEQGMVLSGGNSYVSVNYTVEAMEPTVALALSKLTEVDKSGASCDVFGRLVHFDRGAGVWRTVVDGKFSLYCYGMEHSARQLAEAHLSGTLVA